MTIKSILLIGGHGYIGSALMQSLQKKFEITAPRRYELDLGKPETFSVLKQKKFDLIIMLASSIRAIGEGQLDPTILKENVCDLNHFLQFVKENSVTNKFINLSSMAVYGKQTTVLIKETNHLNPQSLYGLTKKMAEDLVRYYAQADHLSTVNLRIPGIYGGKRQSGLLFHAKNKAKKNEAITVETNGLTNWETLHLADLCHLLETFIKQYSWQQPHEVFNLGYGHQTDLIQTVKTIVKTLNSQSEVLVKKKDYDDFYMATEKIQSVLKSTVNFEKSLYEFLNE